MSNIVPIGQCGVCGQYFDTRKGKQFIVQPETYLDYSTMKPVTVDGKTHHVCPGYITNNGDGSP